MSADRFNFLEFGEDEAGTDQPTPEDQPEPVARDITAELFADGSTMAQVKFADPRGYGTHQDEDEDGEVTLSSLAAQVGKPPTKLRVVEVFGERGVKAGQFHYPTGMAADGAGVLFIADAHNHRVQRVTPGGGVSIIGGRGSGRGQFLSPQGVATDAEDSFYVVEQGNHRVQKFTRGGVLVLVFGRQGRAEGELNGPTAISVAPLSGDIFLADTGNSRVQRFDAEGRFLNAIGAPGAYFPHLSSPQAVATEPGGGLAVADTFAQRLLRYDPLGRMDTQIGGEVRRWNAPPAVSFYQPRALAADPAGLLYVADGGEPDVLTGETRGRVQCLSLPDGKVLATLEKAGRGLGTLLRPGGLAVGPSAEGSPRGPIPRGDLYVADTLNHRILRFVWS